MELLLLKLDAKLEEKFNQQTNIITTAVTTNVLEALDEKMKKLMEENQKLKDKVTILEQKINNLEKDKRKNNLIFFGIEGNGKREAELVDYIKETIEEAGTHLDSHEIKNIYRIGAQTSKNRPVVVTLSTVWKKHQILKAKSNLPAGIYVKEDFPKEVLEARKQIQPIVEAEWKKGNIAFLRGGQLVIKKHTNNQREKRKRNQSVSPNSETVKKPNTANNFETQANKTYTTGQRELLRPGILQYLERDTTKPTPTTDSSKN